MQKKVIIWVRYCTCSHHSCLRKSGNYRYTWLIKTISCPSACTLNHMNDIFFSCVVSSPLHLLMVCLTCIVGRVTVLHLCELLFLSSSDHYRISLQPHIYLWNKFREENRTLLVSCSGNGDTEIKGLAYGWRGSLTKPQIKPSSSEPMIITRPFSPVN